MQRLQSASRLTSQRCTLYACAALAAVVLGIYSRVFHCGFLTFDDQSHVTANRAVMNGLSLYSVAWGFTHLIGCQWIPLAWISHALDVTIFGLDPGWHHLVNVAWHALNACLVFLALRKLTCEFWPSFAVAALFAVHPINVESVAWISERKNVLSTTFWLLAVWSYTLYARSSRRRWLAAAGAAMALGLLAKPMLVTLPCALLVLDFCPLRRYLLIPWRRLLLEKSPLFLLSAASSCSTLFAASHERFLARPAALPISARLGNAVVNYVCYLSKIFWPRDLAVLYPLRASVPPLLLAASLVLLLGITAACIATRRSQPFLLAGWLWFLGTLVPVIGLMQIGAQAYADRFTYVPQLGIFCAIVWSARALRFSTFRWEPYAFAAIAACLAVLTMARIDDWTDSATLFEASLRVTPENVPAHANAAMGWIQRGDYRRALGHLRAADRLKPNDAGLQVLMGESLLHLDQNTEALSRLRWALALDPSDEHTRRNVVIFLANQGRAAEAAQCLREPAVPLRP